jgi:acetyltransferase AlgX (SGNH hydrolase-like protein)
VGVLPDEVQQWLADDLGVYDPSLGTLAQPYHTGIFVGSEFRAHYHTDGHGFRNAQPWPDAAEIVVVGDAVAFGYGVEDNQDWPALLAHTMAPTRVINLGLLEAGPQQYARVYATFGTTLHPQLALVGLTMADDFRDAELFARWEHEDSGESYRAWREEQDLLGSLPHSLRVLPAFVTRYSSFYQVLCASLRHARMPSQVVWLVGGKYLQVRPHRLAAVLAQSRPEQPGFHLILDALAYLQVVARAYGTQVLVVIQPSKEMTYLFPNDANDEATPDPTQALQQALTQHGIASLDLTPIFRQWASSGEPLFFTANRYPNAQGQALIAQEVVRYLSTTAQSYGLTP